MKNLKVRTKLIVGFIIVSLLTLIVGIAGIISLNVLNRDYTEVIEMHGKPLYYAGSSLEAIHSLRAETRGAIIYSGDEKNLQSTENNMNELAKQLEDDLAVYADTIVSPEAMAFLREAEEEYYSVFKPGIFKMLEYSSNRMPQAEMLEFMGTIRPSSDKIAANIRRCMELKTEMLDKTSSNSDDLAGKIFILLMVGMIAAIAISMFLGIYISGLISKPLTSITLFFNKAGATGDLALEREDEEAITKYTHRRDEVGQLIASATKFVLRMADVSKVLEVFSSGDLTMEFPLLSDRDSMGLSLKKLLDGFKETQKKSAFVNQRCSFVNFFKKHATKRALLVKFLPFSNF